MNRTSKFFFTFTRNATSKVPNFKNIGVGAYALLSVPIATFCLGTWQVKRRAWKINLIEEVKEKHRAPPIDFPENAEELSGMEYHRVKLRGTFDHSRELFITPRQLISAESDEGGGIFSSRPQSGSHVITPFHLSDQNITILVNRGWVPKSKTDPSKRSQGQVEGEVELIGTVRLPEKRPPLLPQHKGNQNEFQFRDVPVMARLANAAPVFMDAGHESSTPGGPVGGQTRITFRNEHLSYIFTWYSLSAITTYMWYRRFFFIAK